MRGICGFIHIDGQAAASRALEAMQAALALTPWSAASQEVTEHAAFAEVCWAMQPRRSPLPGWARDSATGCIVAADAHLRDKPALASRLGLPADHPDARNDAALILHAWQRWQERAPQHLDGEFAFAVHDARRQVVFLARDRMGIRPLYLHLAPGRLLAFGSSARAVLAHPGVPQALNEARIADLLVTQLEGIDKTSTFHTHVERLPPAHWLLVERNGARQRRYWSLEDEPATTAARTDDEWAEAVRDALEQAVRHHLAGHCVGAMVSGGMDSSSLAALAAAELGATGMGPLRTYSLVDSRSPNSETLAVHAMLGLRGFAPRLLDHVSSGAMAEAAWDHAWHCEEPFDAMMLPLHAPYWAAAADGVEGVIDGVDGDMPFLIGNGMSRQLRRGHLLETWRNVQGLARTYPMGPTAGQQFAQVARRALVPDWARRLRHAWQPNAPTAIADAGSPIHPEFAQRVNLTARLDQLAGWMMRLPHWSARAEAQEILDHPFLTVGVERYHRVAARHGIQPLHPFLDRRCLGLFINLPDHQRLHDGWTKAVLRRAMAGRLPARVLQRQDKQHLGWAQTQALLQRHRAVVVERLHAQQERLRGYVSPEAIRQALATPAEAAVDADEWSLLFNLATLADWLDRQAVRCPHSAPAQEKLAFEI